MKNILFKLFAILFVGVLAQNLYAADVSEKEAKKGSKTYQKKFKGRCDNMTGAKLAAMHDQDEWEDLYDEGEFVDEIKSICPATDKMKFRDKDTERLFHFLYFYGADSGKVPSCG